MVSIKKKGEANKKVKNHTDTKPPSPPEVKSNDEIIKINKNLDELIEPELTQFEILVSDEDIDKVEIINDDQNKDTTDTIDIDKVNKKLEAKEVKEDTLLDKAYIDKIQLKKKAIEKIAPKSTDDCLIMAILDYMFYIYFLVMAIILLKDMDFSEKSTVVNEYIEQIKPQLDSIKLQIERFISINFPKQYNKLVKLNDMSFIIGVISITIGFYTVCNEINKERGKTSKKSKQPITEPNNLNTNPNINPNLNTNPNLNINPNQNINSNNAITIQSNNKVEDYSFLM